MNETGRTTWDTVFALAPRGGATELTIRMDARSSRPLLRLLLPLVCVVVRGAVARDMDAVKAYCEGRGA